MTWQARWSWWGALGLGVLLAALTWADGDRPALLAALSLHVLLVAGLAAQAAAAREHARTSAAREAAEQARAATVAELEERIAERNAALDQRTSDLSHFVYAASHDLNSPLRSIANLVGWLEEDHGDELSAEAMKLVAELRARVGRMDRLLAALLGHSRIGRVEIPVEPVDLGELVRQVGTEVGYGEAFTLDYAGDAVLQTQRPALEMVMTNLLQNARVHHDHPSGVTRVEAAADGDSWRIRVADDGPGIPAESTESVFQMFTRLGRSAAPGSGMGLALVRRQVEVLGGSAEVVGAGGRGTTVEIRLPKTFSLCPVAPPL
ncbi:MAG: HAMP domain-containing sensor histidine kinase [Myxococcota bacterium]